MGIIAMTKTIKEVHEKDLVFVKIGDFFHSYGKDSYIISYLFGYMLKKVDDVSMCGFPSSSINKVMAKMEECKINYLIIDRRNNYDIDEISDNKNLNQYVAYLDKAKEYVKRKEKIDRVNQFLTENISEEEFKEIIEGIEKVIYERRKV